MNGRNTHKISEAPLIHKHTYMLFRYIYIYVHTQWHQMKGGEPGSYGTIPFYARYRHSQTQYDIWDICQHITNLLPINDEAKLM